MAIQESVGGAPGLPRSARDDGKIVSWGGKAKAASAILLLFALANCSGPFTPATCPPGTGTPTRIFTLYFGQSIPNRAPLNDAEWQVFQSQFITANLPDGYTILDGTGAWRAPDSRSTIAETTKILIAAEPDTQASLAANERVRAAYKTAFHQQSVGMTNQAACGSFQD